MLQPMIFANKTHTFTFFEIFIYAFLIEVKWALGSITTNKASGGDGISVELSQIKRGCCESAALNMPANLENSAVATGLEKVSFH